MAKISKERIGEYLKTSLQVIQDNGGQLPSSEVLTEVENAEYKKAQTAKLLSEIDTSQLEQVLRMVEMMRQDSSSGEIPQAQLQEAPAQPPIMSEQAVEVGNEY